MVLISPPSSPVLLPVNGDMKHDPSYEINVQKYRVPGGGENIPPPTRVSFSPSFIPLSNFSLSFSQVALNMKIQYIYFFVCKYIVDLLLWYATNNNANCKLVVSCMCVCV